MAAPNKIGIDYYPWEVDVDQDDKLAMIIGEYGYKGEFLYQKLCAWIYKHGGYCIIWDEQEQLKFAKRVAYICGSSVNLPRDVAAGCVKWGLFDRTVFDSFQILTSERIQETWLEATRKRKTREIDQRFWILPDTSLNYLKNVTVINKFRNNPELTPLIPPLTTQSKVKESKVNGDDERSPPPAPPLPPRPPTPKPGDIIPFISLEENKSIALADTGMHGFVETFARAGLMPELLGRWMDAFHRQLAFEEVTLKQQKDYRKHFRDWIKFQDYRTGNPEDFSPVRHAQTSTPKPESTHRRLL